MPEDSVEQRVNAAAIERLGIGMRVAGETITPELVRRFVHYERQYRDRTRWHARDGRAEAVRALERFAAELAPTPPTRFERKSA
jgi:hypothetical protein